MHSHLCTHQKISKSDWRIMRWQRSILKQEEPLRQPVPYWRFSSVTGAYAADIGGIQRTIQIWIHGDLTDAILRVDEEEGTYSLTDGKGNVVEEGGGVAIEADGTERPLTSEEIAEDMENQVTTDTIDGRMYLFYGKQKYDITDEFSGSDYCYLTLKDGDRTIYVTVTKNGGIATSEKRYLMPNEFCVE